MAWARFIAPEDFLFFLGCGIFHANKRLLSLRLSNHFIFAASIQRHSFLFKLLAFLYILYKTPHKIPRKNIPNNAHFSSKQPNSHPRTLISPSEPQLSFILSPKTVNLRPLQNHSKPAYSYPSRGINTKAEVTSIKDASLSDIFWYE